MNGLELKKIRNSLNLTQTELADKVGVSMRTVQNWEKDVNKIPKSTELILIELSKSTEFSLSEPKSEYKVQGKIEAMQVDFKEMSTMYVPLINQYAYGGYMNGFGDMEYIESLPKIPFSADQEHRGEYLCFEVKGDSMDDGTVDAILERDILLCRNIRKDYWKSKLHINKWDFVIVHREKGIVVKRIIKHDVDSCTLTLHSLNEEYEDFEIHLKDVAQILNIVDIKRNRKR